VGIEEGVADYGICSDLKQLVKVPAISMVLQGLGP
jgi:hypothetical protein